MGEHGPETTHGCGREVEAKLPEIALDKRAHEIVAPGDTERFAAGQKRTRKTAALPEPAGLLRPGLAQSESGQIDESDAAGERLGRLPQQFGRSAAEHQKAGGTRFAVGEHPQDGKQIGPSATPLDTGSRVLRFVSNFAWFAA